MTADRVLVANAGSSSLKLRVLDMADVVVASADMPAPHEGAIDGIADTIRGLGLVDAVGHRVVHGGTRFTAPVVVDDAVADELVALVPLAPLHQPATLAALAAVRTALPDVPSVACFDTAFHATIPDAAATYALPAEWRVRWGLRRYGFHGLSHAYAARRTAELLGQPADGLRIVTCHLGAGASLAAVRDGRSVDTTMGFTPLEGLVMATRSGSVDPGIVIWLAEHVDVPPAEVGAALERRSGLLGLAGTADMREVVERAEAGDADARLALDVYVHRLRAGIAAMAASAGGLDALVFTGGVGERSAVVRARAAEGLGFLGVELDAARNEATLALPDREIGALRSTVRTLVIEAREDLEIARETRDALVGRS